MPFRVSGAFSTLNNQLGGFADYVTANKTRLGITDAEETNLTNQQTAWNAAWLNYNDATKQTTPVRETQQALYKSLHTLMNQLRKQLKNNAGITLTDDDYAQLQIHRDKTTRTLTPKPTLAPNIELQTTHRLYIELNFSSPLSPESNKRALPPGVSRIELQELFSDTEVAPPDAAFLAVADIGRSNIKLTFDPSEANKFAIFRARYQNSRGEAGPWSAHRAVAINA